MLWTKITFKEMAFEQDRLTDPKSKNIATNGKKTNPIHRTRVEQRAGKYGFNAFFKVSKRGGR